MTALDTLLLNLTPTITAGIEMRVTSTIMEDRDEDEQLTTLVLAATTILDSIKVPDELVIVRDTISYVESLSDEELTKIDELLSAKGIEFDTTNELEESPKMFIKTDTHKQL